MKKLIWKAFKAFYKELEKKIESLLKDVVSTSPSLVR